MTLAPVFRSGKLFDILESQGIVGRFSVAMERMYGGVGRIHGDLPSVIDAGFLQFPDVPAKLADDREFAAEFLRTYFFLILFSAVFEEMGIDKRRLDFYSELSYNIMGTIAAADNLFDSEAKAFLPLKPVSGATYSSILQLMCFERLTMRSAQRAIDEGAIDAAAWHEAHRGLLSAMATIGRLEGGEEAGFDSILEPEEMVKKVHMVRGGMLFGLVTVAPLAIEEAQMRLSLMEVGEALVKLGTAFQLVDDITDIEFDLTRRSHNILVSEVHHRGTTAERALLASLLAGRTPVPGEVDSGFSSSARRVLDVAEKLTFESLAALEKNGFWFPSSLASVVVQGIVADHGAARMESLAAR